MRMNGGSLPAATAGANSRRTGSTRGSSSATCHTTASAGPFAACTTRKPPTRKSKLIRCIRGALYDVVVDIRPESATFRQWAALELRARPGQLSQMLYVPEGFAHGFLTLEDDTEVLYQMSEFYAPQAARGFRWNDPAFSVDWPEPVRVISDRDSSYPDFAVDRPQVAAS